MFFTVNPKNFTSAPIQQPAHPRSARRRTDSAKSSHSRRLQRSDSTNSQRQQSKQHVTSAVNHFYDKRYTVAIEKVRSQYHHTARLFEIKSGSRCSSR